jgi:aldehyde dehydrogenase (NAD+)
LKDEGDVAFKHRIYRMVGFLVKKRLPTPFPGPIFTENIDTIMNFVEEVETGMVHVNEPTIGGEAQLPFGGTKATGVGEREMAVEGLNFFTELKTVFINYSGKAERLMIR